MIRCAVGGLNGVDARQAVDLSRGQQLREPDMAAHDVAALAERGDDAIRSLKTQLLPKLERQGLRPFEEKGLMVVAGVEGAFGFRQRGVGDIVPAALDRDDLGAHRRHLDLLRFRRGGGDHDAAIETQRRGIGRGGCAGIAGGILQERRHADLFQIVQHDRGAAVLEGSACHQIIGFHMHRHTVPYRCQERSPACAQRCLRWARQTHRGTVAPQRVLGAVDIVRREARARRQVDVAAVVSRLP